MRKLGESKIEAIRDIIDTEGLQSIQEILGMLVQQMEKDVLTCDLNTHSFSQLAMTKSKAEGARLLLDKFSREINNIKGVK